MLLKSKKTYQIPSTAQMKDLVAKEAMQQLGDLLVQIARNVYDDLNRVQAQIVDDLPTTAKGDNRGILYLLRGTGGATDKLYMVIDTGAATGNSWAFKKIALT